MVSNERSLYIGSSALSPRRRSLTLISVCPPRSTAGFSHIRNLTSATPSRTIERRNPSISAAFFTAFIAGTGDVCLITL